MGKFSKKIFTSFFTIVTLTVLLLNIPLPVVYADPPTVSNVNVTDITQTSVSLNGIIGSDGGAGIHRRGFRQYPDGASVVEEADGGYSVGLFSLTYGGLTCNTTYGVQAYAENDDGFVQDENELSFTTAACGPPTFSSITPTEYAYINNVTSASDIYFSVDQTLTKGTTTITRVGGTADVNSPHACLLKGSALSSGGITLDLSDTTNGCTSNVSNLVSGTIYDFKFEGSNANGEATPVTNTSVTFDSTSPTFSSVTPANSATITGISHITSSSVISFTTNEDLANGVITISQTSGSTDLNSPHSCVLIGTALNAGSKTIDLSDTTNSCTSDTSNLVDGATYTFAFDGTDIAGNNASPITRTGVVYYDGFASCYHVEANDADSGVVSGDYLRIYDYNGGMLAYGSSASNEDNLAWDSGSGIWNIGHALVSNDYALTGPSDDATGDYATIGSYNGTPSVTSCDSVAPTVLNVTSTKTNGSYTVGEVIPIDVQFSETVYVNVASPYIDQLNSGGTTVLNGIDSGSGSDTLHFDYTVGSGQNSSDLDYANVNSLNINGATVRDAVGNNADLTLPTPGGTGSLAANKAIVIDTTAPSAPGTPDMTSGTDLGSSSTDNITSSTTPAFTISCESAATVTLLESSTSLGTGTCSSSTVTITSSTLSSGSHSITARQTDGAGNVSATSSALSITIDTTVPTISSVTPANSATIANVTSSSAIAYTLSEAISIGTTTVTRTSGTADASSPHTCVLKGTALNSGAHTLNLSDTTNGCTSDVSNMVSGTTYTFTFAARDTAGNLATTITRTGVVFDTTAPTLSSVTLASNNASTTLAKVGNTVTLTFTATETIGTPTVTFSSGGASASSSPTITNTSGNTWTAIYIVATAHTAGNVTFTIDFADSIGNSGTQVTSTTNSSTVTMDKTAPTISNITSTTANGTYTVGQVIPINLTFSEIVTSTGSSTVTLETGATDRTCTFIVTASTSASCNYTVQSGDTTSDLDVLSVSGTINDAASNAMVSFTPTTGLAANKALVIDTTAPTFSSVTPATSDTIDDVTSSSDIAFTTDEALASGSITITRTSGTADGNSPHTCTLKGTVLNSGAHTVNLSDTTNSCTSDVSNLVSGTVYTFVFAGSDAAGNTATSITRTGVTYTPVVVSPPTVTTVSGSSVSDTAATVGGNITSTGGENATARGFQSGTSISYGATTSESGSYSTGSYTLLIPSLTCGTTYHFRAYASNSGGTSYGSDDTFTTSACPTSGGGGGSSSSHSGSGGGRYVYQPSGADVFVPNVLTVNGVEVNDSGLIDPTASVLTPPLTPQAALQGEWNLLPPTVTDNFVLAPLPRELTNLTTKFPQLTKVFTSLGITTVADLDKLQNVKINLPVVRDIASAPSEIVVASVSGGQINIGSSLNITRGGDIEQMIHTLGGKSMTLEVKPDGAAKSITGYLIFRQATGPTVLNMPTDSIVAAAILSVSKAPVATDIEPKMLLTSFEYTDPDHDGIYTATIDTPKTEGDYEIITLIHYTDPKLGSKELRLVTVIDPEGYVYEENNQGQEIRIEKTKVSIFTVHADGTSSLWDADEYNQTNPQTTDKTGKYAFLVPAGRYFIIAEASGYAPYESDVFTVKEGDSIHSNIELIKNNLWLYNLLDWKFAIILIVIGIFVTHLIERRRMV